MNTKQALTKLTKLLGKTAALRDRKIITSPELRETQQAKRREVCLSFKTIKEQLAERQHALLSADAEYQRLRALYNEAYNLREKTPHGLTYRYEALTTGSLFATIQAEADTLDELVAKVEAKKAAA